jgi:hypothetical protein
MFQRLRFADDRKAIQYSLQAKGPKGEPTLTEITFDIE